MNIEQEIRTQIEINRGLKLAVGEINRGLKLAVGEINNHLSALEGLLRNERDDAQKRVDEAYHRGIDDAWEAARKIALNSNDGGLGIEDLDAIFDCYTLQQVFKKHTAQEALEKLKAYEAEQGHSDTIDESYTIGYKQANNNSKSNTECDGCLYDDGIKEHSLCHTCSNAYINHWTAKPQEDEEIKVGDEVVEIQSSARFCVTHFWVNNHGEKGVSGFNHECSAFQDTFDKVKKTGRHFDIEKILEEMKK